MLWLGAQQSAVKPVQQSSPGECVGYCSQALPKVQLSSLTAVLFAFNCIIGGENEEGFFRCSDAVLPGGSYLVLTSGC